MDIITVLWLAIGLFGFWISLGRLWAAAYPIWQERKNKRLLLEKFSKGPYDEATIRAAMRYYIRPKCSNIDASQESELRHAAVATKEDLFEKVDDFLDHHDSHRHLLVLADSGTGKTSFVLNYFAYNAQRPKRKRHRLALVPLGHPDADKLISSNPDKENTVIFLDALDEDTKAILDDHDQRVRDLMGRCHSFKRVVITCRTQFFSRDEEIPVDTGILRLAPRPAGEGRTYEFWKLYLSPFDDKDINHYLSKRYPIWSYRLRRKAARLAYKIPKLSVRPMLLAHIPELVASQVKIQYVYELYNVMVNAWLKREAPWVKEESLRRFSEQLAIDLYINKNTRATERISSWELSKLATQWRIDLDRWQITGRSLLNRDAQGNYKFAHRSIMEHLFVLQLLKGNKKCQGVILTDQMKLFLFEHVHLDLSYIRLLSYISLYAQPVRPHFPDLKYKHEMSLRNLPLGVKPVIQIINESSTDMRFVRLSPESREFVLYFVPPGNVLEEPLLQLPPCSSLQQSDRGG